MAPSLNQSFGYRRRQNNKTSDKMITIIRNNYLKNIRDDLLEEESANTTNRSNEITYITAEIDGIPTKIMIDTGANMSLIDSTEFRRKVEKSYPLYP